jgi:hypothetical protein
VYGTEKDDLVAMDSACRGQSVVLASVIKRVIRIVQTSIREYLNRTVAGDNMAARLYADVPGLVFNLKFST